MQSSIEPLFRAGREALATGDVHRVNQVAAALRDMPGGVAESYFLVSVVEAGTDRLMAAIDAVRTATSLAQNAEYEAHLARLLLQTGRHAEARLATEYAETRHPQSAKTLDTLGCIYTRLGSHADAARLFEQAVAQSPTDHAIRYNFAVALGFLGRTDEAEQQFDVIIAALPTDGRAHFALSGLRRQTHEQNHVARLERALTLASNLGDRLRIRFALAKEYEECAQPDDALRHLRSASEQRRGEIGYDFARDARLFDAVEQLFDDPEPLTGTGDETKSPIFVVGMPRTGTTLVDRILSSHSEVRSVGELTAMPIAVKQAGGSRTGGIFDAEAIAQARRADAAKIAACYLARAEQDPAAHAARFVDKLPFNFLYVGFILRAFPKAKIVCVRRDPMDTIWSNYRHLFAEDSVFHGYSYDPEDIARYYLRFDRLMAIWRARFPDAVHELVYENLIHDQPGETRRLLDHCKLTWDANCLRFHENTAAVATPSANQVRRPLNADAVGHWRPFAGALDAARRLIANAGGEPV